MEYQYAKYLAIALWKTYYKDDSPEWEPRTDLMGVLTQIDNMIAGLPGKLDNKGSHKIKLIVSRLRRWKPSAIIGRQHR